MQSLTYAHLSVSIVFVFVFEWPQLIYTVVFSFRCAKYSMRSSDVQLAVAADVPSLVHIDPTRVRQVP